MPTPTPADVLAAGLRRQASDYLDSSLRAARVAHVRAEKARRMADICERKAHGMTERASLYHAEARRLRSVAEGHDADAAWHEETATALRALGPRN